MAHLSDGLFLRPQLGSFSASVFQCTIILLLLTDSCGGLPQGVVVASVGDDVILPCHLEPAENAVSKTLEWGRLDLEPRFVHVWYEGRDYLANQNPSYKGRTSVSVQRLQQGDLSLQLSALKPSDSGIYRCYFPSQDKHSTVELIVGSVSSPVITDINLNSREVELQCESQGWHPEPEVLWLDGEGNPVSAGPTEKVLGPDGLYAVSSRATVEKRRSSSFTCRVQQKAINQAREAFIQVSADCLGIVSCYAVRFSVVFVVFFLFAFAVAFVWWRWRQDQTREAKKHQKAEAERREKEELMAEDEMEKKKAKLREKLQKKEEEKEDLKQVVETLKKQKEELENQKEQLVKQKEEMDKTFEDLESVEKMVDSDEEKRITSTALKELVNRRKEDEKLVLQILTQLNETNTFFNKMKGTTSTATQQLVNRRQEDEKLVLQILTQVNETNTLLNKITKITSTAKTQLLNRRQVDEKLLEIEKQLNETNSSLNKMTERRTALENHVKKIKETLEEIERKHPE